MARRVKQHAYSTSVVASDAGGIIAPLNRGLIIFEFRAGVRSFPVLGSSRLCGLRFLAVAGDGGLVVSWAGPRDSGGGRTPRGPPRNGRKA
jgi:hypothetical protein